MRVPACSRTCLWRVGLNTDMKIAIVGLGYVGLPLSLQFAKSGAQVLGLDIDPAKVNWLNRGRSYIKHIRSEDILAQRTADAAVKEAQEEAQRTVAAAQEHADVLLSEAEATSRRMVSLEELPGYDFILCDVTPRQLLQLAKERLSPGYSRQLSKYRYGPAVFKVDYALDRPIPWKARECLRAVTVHLGGSFDEIAASEKAVSLGQHAERPMVLVAQPSLFDPTRASGGRHTAWAYCHVPNGSEFDMLSRLEDQIERFAPGFRDCILARRVFSPALLEKMDANLVGGDIGGGASDLRQFLFRPTWRRYATSARDIYICSSSTPPGGGVHGMCGYHAARLALSRQ